MQPLYMRPAARAFLAFLVCLSLFALSCSGEGYRRKGSALAEGGSLYRERDAPYRVGDEWNFMSIFLHNVSSEPVELVEVKPLGRGVGATVVILDAKVGPLAGTNSERPPFGETLDVGASGIWKTMPPVFFDEGGRCHRQRLEDVAGFVLRPDAEARIMLHMRAEQPGSFDLDGATIVYRQDDELVEQTMLSGMVGKVAVNGESLPIDQDWEKPCLNRTTVLP